MKLKPPELKSPFKWLLLYHDESNIFHKSTVTLNLLPRLSPYQQTLSILN